MFDEKFCKKIQKLVKERYGNGHGRRRTRKLSETEQYMGFYHGSGSSSGTNSGNGQDIHYLYGEKYPDWLQPRVIHPSMLDAMITPTDLDRIDLSYFDIVSIKPYPLTIRSQSTGHYWSLLERISNGCRTFVIFSSCFYLTASYN